MTANAENRARTERESPTGGNVRSLKGREGYGRRDGANPGIAARIVSRYGERPAGTAQGRLTTSI